jgi:aryl-alcohol dehydrogenase-like predicted oxidoreductase
LARKYLAVCDLETMAQFPMNRHSLGTTGIEISPIILGCGTFGGIGGAKALIGHGLNREAAVATLNDSLALGINVLDTAERYASGESELVIGEWLRQQPASVVSELHIATKVAPPSADGDVGKRFDREFIQSKLTMSLERLGVDSISFYLSHAPDPETPIEQTLEGFAAAIESKQVRHIGCCNVDGDQLRTALDASDRLGLPAFEWVQNGFSLLSPKADDEVRNICIDRNLGFTPFSPLAGGVLTGKYRRGEPFPAESRMALYPGGIDQLLTDEIFDAIDQLGAEATRRGVSTAALALAWVLAHPQCTASVVGPSRTAPHLSHVAEALKIALTPQMVSIMTGWFSAG